MQNINKPEIVPSFNILQSITVKQSSAFLSSFSGHLCSTVSMFPQVQMKQLLFFLSCPHVARYSFSTFGNPFQRVFCMVLHLTLIALGYKASGLLSSRSILLVVKANIIPQGPDGQCLNLKVQWEDVGYSLSMDNIKLCKPGVYAALRIT